MKIGILTFANAYNLGAALQAFSLQKSLIEIGTDAELIDYRCPAIENMHKLRPVFNKKISLKQRAHNVIYNIVFFPRRLRYKKFQHSMKRSNIFTRDTICETNGLYDIFITGSDQVFNLKLTDNDSTYYLDFVNEGIKASYAASLGPYLSDQKDNYKRYLESFDYLSVREKNTAEIFEKELGIITEVMPDPVFLHTGEEWKKLIGISSKIKKPNYVLVYSLVETEELYDIAHKVAEIKDLKVFVITKVLKPKGYADKIFRNTGPKEFIDLVVNADYVVTNSFHGTAFSLIFEKQFTVFMPPAAPERIINLLMFVELQRRATRSCDIFDSTIIDYKQIRNTVKNMKDMGEDCLKMVIRASKGFD